MENANTPCVTFSSVYRLLMTVSAIMNRAVSEFASRFGADSKCNRWVENVLSNNLQVSDEVVHLVLDLDHTLISSFEFGDGGPAHRSGKPSGGNTVSPILVEKYKDDYGLPEMYHAVISGVVVLIKLRPFVRRFIRTAHSLGYHLHVYTKGRRTYMKEVIGLIDPDCEYIKGRHISRDDEPAHFRDNQKDIRLIFEGGSSKKYLVLDDSPQVWISGEISPRAVVAAKKYLFSDSFVSTLRASASSTHMDYPTDEDSYLSTILVTFSETVFKIYERKRDASPISRSSTTVSDDDAETAAPQILTYDF